MIGEILEIGRELLKHPVELFSGVPEALERLSRQANLILLTKGDLLHQELKIAASGVAEWFQAIEIVSDKSASVLMRMIAKHSLRANTLIVVGDSLRSDILPALEIGAWAAHIPHPLAWSHERAILPALAERFRELTNLSEVQTWNR